MRKLAVLSLSISMLLLATSALAGGGSSGDPLGEAPFGVVTQSEAKGTKLSGVMVMEVALLDEETASSIRTIARLRQGPQLGTVHAFVPGPFQLEDTPEIQAAVFAALAPRVKAKFFSVECGNFGDECPTIELVLKSIEEVGNVDDGVSLLFHVADIVVSATEPTK